MADMVQPRSPARKTVQQRYSARKFLNRTTEELSKMLTGTFTVVFEDDVELVMRDTEVIFSSHFWDIHRQLPWLPIISKHTVNAVSKNGVLNASTNISFAEKLFWFVADTAVEKGITLDVNAVDALNENIYRISNDLYNHGVLSHEPSVISTDLEDYIELLDYPPIEVLMKHLEPTEESIAKTYYDIIKVINSDPGIAHNELVRAVKSGMVRMAQLVQCIICRGFVTDINSMIFPEPSMGGFVGGYSDYYSLFIDTRTAAKSLYFSAKLLKTSEYNSRKLQILCQSVATVHPGDCGSTYYMHFKIKPDEVNEDGSVRKGDLSRFAGKYFLDEDNKLKELKPTDTQYLGKVLRFRSPLAGCAHSDPHGVCSVCFGAMSLIIPEHTNIGYMLTAALMQILSQSILAVKHLDSTSSSAPVVLTAHQKKYLETDDTGKAYLFAKALTGKKISLVLSADQISALASLQNVEDFSSVVPGHFSDINMTLLNISNDDSFENMESGIPLDLSSDKRNAFFTPEALAYINKKGWTKTSKGQIIFDFSDWDNKTAFAALPQRHFNNADHAKDIADLIQGRNGQKDDRFKRKQDGSVIDYFIDFYNLVNSRLDVPMVILEHIIYGASIRNSEKRDYRLPRAGTTKEMGLTASAVPFRSMGAGMGYEHHVAALFKSTQGFDPNLIASHVMDVFVLPQEAIEDATRRGIR